jgi:hypothetical protein
MCRQNSSKNSSQKKLKPPFVEIDGTIIDQATIEKVLNTVEAELQGVTNAYDE